MLVIRHTDGLDCPTAACDYCGSAIEDAKQGNYQWLPEDGVIFFTHKACCRAFEQSRDGDWMAMGLELLPLYLKNNLKIKFNADMRQKAELFS